MTEAKDSKMSTSERISALVSGYLEAAGFFRAGDLTLCATGSDDLPDEDRALLLAADLIATRLLDGDTDDVHQGVKNVLCKLLRPREAPPAPESVAAQLQAFGAACGEANERWRGPPATVRQLLTAILTCSPSVCPPGASGYEEATAAQIVEWAQEAADLILGDPS